MRGRRAAGAAQRAVIRGGGRGPRAGGEDEEQAMMRLMGFGSFDTTKGEEVSGNKDTGAVKVRSTRQARQYMNRKGGFNRPLPAEKTGQKVNER